MRTLAASILLGIASAFSEEAMKDAMHELVHVVKEGKLVSKEGVLVEKQGKLVIRDGLLVDKYGTLTNKEGKLMSTEVAIVTKGGLMVADKDELISHQNLVQGFAEHTLPGMKLDGKVRLRQCEPLYGQEFAFTDQEFYNFPTPEKPLNINYKAKAKRDFFVEKAAFNAYWDSAPDFQQEKILNKQVKKDEKFVFQDSFNIPLPEKGFEGTYQAQVDFFGPGEKEGGCILVEFKLVN